MLVKLSRLFLILIVASFMGGCKTGYVYNDDRSGPIFVKPRPAEPKPVPKPFKVLKPDVVRLSVAQQNKRAVSTLIGKGFDAVENDRGVVVYLPPTIYFKDSESSITLVARSKIAEVAQELLLPYLAEREVEVSGHTDTLGSSSANMALSEKRALAATAELVFSKVPKTRLSSTWFGESRLREPDFDQDGSINLDNVNLNRRVEFTILNPE